MQNELERCTERQKKKFERCRKQTDKAIPDMSHTVVNLTERQLTEEEVSVLQKGGNFAIIPRTIPMEDIIANTEAAIRTLPCERAEEIRTETARILRRAKPPACNLKKEEVQAIKNLNADKSILPHVGKTDTYIKRSGHFIDKLKKLKLAPNDILVSFDVVSLFTKVPLSDALEHIGSMFPQDIKKLFHACLTTSYFTWNGDFYEQLEGVAMGSPLSPVVANFFMEQFEAQALDSATCKPKVWYRYVDDTFVVWSHGEEQLGEFLRPLNSLHANITFTMEVEKDKKLPFLDVLVTRDGENLGHSVYRKPTHTDRYLHKLSNHHPSQKRGMISTLVTRAGRICEPQHLKREMQHLETVLRSNGYSTNYIRSVTEPNTRRSKEPEKEMSECQPYIGGRTLHVSKVVNQGTPSGDQLCVTSAPECTVPEDWPNRNPKGEPKWR
ncbi:uncharacterized protein LOC126199468 [Schistocerca nitens]|uniref:uncharacterized protein LOC126199468 n=1 Tax=Schistocerca nitens TaxID=7011 RepID=UPI002117FC35|nr:uncharacterized protein LOC126199468 [Schistocerca nitens]